MSNLKTAVISLASGIAIGYSTQKIQQPQYTLTEKNNETYIKTTNIRDVPKIYEIKNTFYVGNREHNIQGAINTAYQEGYEKKDEELKKALNEKELLEDKIKDKNKKIRRRRFFDKIDEIKDNINYWYQDLKRRQLE